MSHAVIYLAFEQKCQVDVLASGLAAVYQFINKQVKALETAT